MSEISLALHRDRFDFPEGDSPGNHDTSGFDDMDADCSLARARRPETSACAGLSIGTCLLPRWVDHATQQHIGNVGFIRQPNPFVQKPLG